MGPEKGGVERRSREFPVVVSGLKFDDPIELEEILWRLICGDIHQTERVGQ